MHPVGFFMWIILWCTDRRTPKNIELPTFRGHVVPPSSRVESPVNGSVSMCLPKCTLNHRRGRWSYSDQVQLQWTYTNKSQIRPTLSQNIPILNLFKIRLAGFNMGHADNKGTGETFLTSTRFTHFTVGSLKDRGHHTDSFHATIIPSHQHA